MRIKLFTIAHDTKEARAASLLIHWSYNDPNSTEIGFNSVFTRD